MTRCCALFVVVFVAVGCESVGITPPANKLLPDAKEIRSTAPVPAPVSRELAKELFGSYIIEPSDVLLVQPADLDAPLHLPPDQTVLADGTIDLGIYGRPLVAGKTQEQVAAEIKQLINAKEKPKEPIAITVRLIGRNTNVFYVLGEVNAPGAFPVTGFETVLDGIVKAGGVTRRASEQDIILSRPTLPEGCRVVYPVCYPQIVQLGDTTTNYQIQPGDRIYVPSQGIFGNLFPQRCKRGGPCNRPQIGCGAGTCAANACSNTISLTPASAPISLTPPAPPGLKLPEAPSPISLTPLAFPGLKLPEPQNSVSQNSVSLTPPVSPTLTPPENKANAVPPMPAAPPILTLPESPNAVPPTPSAAPTRKLP